ncbi:MAG TPA: ROK family protein [Blastocatellia bacterium]|nr:ROK family protein [Blastocatellia bacterium]
MSDEETFVGLDVGRMIRGALVTSEGRVLSEHRIVSEITDRRVFIDQLASVINQLSQGSGANAAGVGWAGMVNYSQQRVAANTNLLDVSPFDLRAELERSTGLPIVLDNDANVAAYAEWQCGAARGASNVLFITMGTGIGAGIILGSQLQRGACGFAGEFGHIRVEPDGLECACGSTGCLETLASGPNIVRRVREKLFSDPGFSVSQLASDMEGTLTAQRVFQAAMENDDLAVSVLDETGQILGSAVASVINLLNVEVVVIGGGLMAAGNFILQPLQEQVRRSAVGVAYECCRIVAAQLGQSAGMIGAALMARDGRQT